MGSWSFPAALNMAFHFVGGLLQPPLLCQRKRISLMSPAFIGRRRPHQTSCCSPAIGQRNLQRQWAATVRAARAALVLLVTLLGDAMPPSSAKMRQEGEPQRQHSCQQRFRPLPSQGYWLHTWRFMALRSCLICEHGDGLISAGYVHSRSSMAAVG